MTTKHVFKAFVILALVGMPWLPGVTTSIVTNARNIFLSSSNGVSGESSSTFMILPSSIFIVS